MTRRDANAVAKGRFLDRKAQKPRLACRWSPTPEKRFRTVWLNSAPGTGSILLARSI
jgi:hypothetical protein